MKSTNQVGAVLLPMFLILMTSLVVELHTKLDFRFCLVLLHLVFAVRVSSCPWLESLAVYTVCHMPSWMFHTSVHNIQECTSRNVQS